MQISPRVHALRIPFVLEPVPGRKLERSVHAYLLQAGEVTLIDSGVAGAGAAIFHCLENLGGSPGEITRLLLTHAHPDHLGGAPGVAASAGCMVAAHPLDVPWIEDTERQFRERPVPGFHDLVEGPVKVSQLLKDNDVLELGDGAHLRALHTPGHSRGHLAFLLEEEGVLFCGDCLPQQGTFPIYEDVLGLAGSIRRLKALPGVKSILSSWDEPRLDTEALSLFDQALDCLQHTHETVWQATRETSSQNPTEIAPLVFQKLGLPPLPPHPVLVESIRAHLRAGNCRNFTG